MLSSLLWSRPASRAKRDSRTVLAIATLIALIPVTSASVASAQFGVAAGANFENLGDLDGDESRASFDRATGYHVGVFFNLGAGMFAVQPGIYLRDFGDVQLVEDARRRTFSMTAIEVPIDLRLHALRGAPLSPFIFAAPVVGFATTSDESFKDTMTDLTLSANIGGGVEIAAPGIGLVITPEIRFARSLTNYFEDGETFDIGGVDFTPTEVSRQSAVMLRLGVRF